jgi:hypothetical protein
MPRKQAAFHIGATAGQYRWDLFSGIFLREIKIISGFLFFRARGYKVLKCVDHLEIIDSYEL